MEDENELDAELSKAPGNPEKSWKDDIAATMNELETRGRDREELEELIGPHREQIAANGHTDASYLRMLVGTAQALGSNPEINGLAQRVHMEGELQRFVKANPDAAEQAFQYRMGLHLQDNPPKPGESVAQSLARARKAVKANDSESKTWQDEAGKVWDQTYGGR
jgi:hypothetical protein